MGMEEEEEEEEEKLDAPRLEGKKVDPLPPLSFHYPNH